MDENLLTTQEAADYLRLSRRTVEGYIYKRKLPYLKIGVNVRIEKKALEAFAKKNTIPAMEV